MRVQMYGREREATQQGTTAGTGIARLPALADQSPRIVRHKLQNDAAAARMMAGMAGDVVMVASHEDLLSVRCLPEPVKQPTRKSCSSARHTNLSSRIATCRLVSPTPVGVFRTGHRQSGCRPKAPWKRRERLIAWHGCHRPIARAAVGVQSCTLFSPRRHQSASWRLRPSAVMHARTTARARATLR